MSRMSCVKTSFEAFVRYQKEALEAFKDTLFYLLLPRKVTRRIESGWFRGERDV